MPATPPPDNTLYWALSGIALLISGLNWLPKLIEQIANARKYKYDAIKEELKKTKQQIYILEVQQMKIDAILIYSKPFIIKDIKDPDVIELFNSLEQINNGINITPAKT